MNKKEKYYLRLNGILNTGIVWPQVTCIYILTHLYLFDPSGSVYLIKIYIIFISCYLHF